MDGLRDAAQQHYRTLARFYREPNAQVADETMHLIRMTDALTEERPLHRTPVKNERELFRELDTAEQAADRAMPGASLILASLARDFSYSLCISPDGFDRIINRFGIDPWALRFTTHWGTFVYNTPATSQFRRTFLARSSYSVTVWTFDPETARTYAIRIFRSTSANPIFGLCQRMETYRAYLHTPGFLALSILMGALDFIGDVIEVEAGAISDNLATTLHQDRDAKLRNAKELIDYTGLAARLEFSISRMNVAFDDTELADLLLELLRAQEAEDVLLEAPEELRHMYRRDDSEIKQLLPLVQRTIHAHRLKAQRWKERAQNGFSVVSSLQLLCS